MRINIKNTIGLLALITLAMLAEHVLLVGRPGYNEWSTLPLYAMLGFASYFIIGPIVEREEDLD